MKQPWPADFVEPNSIAIRNSYETVVQIAPYTIISKSPLITRSFSHVSFYLIWVQKVM